MGVMLSHTAYSMSFATGILTTGEAFVPVPPACAASTAGNGGTPSDALPQDPSQFVADSGVEAGHAIARHAVRFGDADARGSGMRGVLDSIQSLVNRGDLEEAMRAWRFAASWLGAGTDAFELHVGVARELLWNQHLMQAREVLEIMPGSGSLEEAETQFLWNVLRHQEESREAGGALFPFSVDFDARWHGPHFRSDVADRPDLVWFPGRIERVGAHDVVLLLGRRTHEGRVALFRKKLDRGAFEASGLRVPEDIPVGRFVELCIFRDAGEEKSVIGIEPPEAEELGDED